MINASVFPFVCWSQSGVKKCASIPSATVDNTNKRVRELSGVEARFGIAVSGGGAGKGVGNATGSGGGSGTGLWSSRQL